MNYDEHEKLAFPQSTKPGLKGMSLREYAAVHALQGLLANRNLNGKPETLANAAVTCADALLAELEKQP